MPLLGSPALNTTRSAASQRLAWLTCALLLGLAQPAQAQTACGPTETTITVDGRFGDWGNVLRNPENLVLDAFGNSAPCGSTGDKDCVTGAGQDLRLAAVTWDTDNLYLFIERFARLGNSNSRYFHFWIDRDDEQQLDAADRDLILQLDVRSMGMMPRRDSLEAELFRLSSGSFPLVDVGDATCGPDGDLPCGDGFFPDDGSAEYVSVVTYPDCPDNGCVGPAGRRFEVAVPWTDLNLEPGQPFAFHLSAGDRRFPQNGNYTGSVFWDNAGGLHGGPASTGFTCHEVVPDRERFALAGETVVHEHSVLNLGNRDATFQLRSTSSHGFTMSLSADLNLNGTPDPAELLYVDANGDGDLDDMGDSVTLIGDSDGDGQPDTGLLAGARVDAPGGEIPLLLSVQVPLAAPLPLVEVNQLEATSADGVVQLATARTHVGQLIAWQDQESSAAPGLLVPYVHLLWNAGGLPDDIGIEVTSSEGWPVTLYHDPGEVTACDGVGAVELTGAISLMPRELACLIALVEVPAGAAPGVIDSTTFRFSSTAAPGVEGLVTDVTTVAPLFELEPSYTVAEGTAKHAGVDSIVLFPHRITNNDELPTAFQVTHSGVDGTYHADPDCDGNPADGWPLVDLTPELPAFGGSGCFILALDTFGLATGTIETNQVFAVPLSSPVETVDTIDELILSRAVTYSDAARRLSETDFRPCDRVHAGASGLTNNRHDEFLLWWEDPDGNRIQADVRSSDLRGETVGTLDLPADATPGTWWLRLFQCPTGPFTPDGACDTLSDSLDAVPFRVGSDARVEPPVTDLPAYPQVTPLLQVSTELVNVEDRALVGTILEHVVLSPDRSLSLDETGAFRPHADGLVTRRRALPEVGPSAALDDVLGLVDLSFPFEAADYLVQVDWRLSCGALLGSSLVTFTVGEPCGGDVPVTGPGSSLRVAAGSVLTWTGLADAEAYPVYRGTLEGLGGLASRGPDPLDHACLDVVPAPGWVDAVPEPPGVVGVYYLVTASNSCGVTAEGLGFGSEGSPRPTPACP
ncbi:MAG: hypothetical protein AAF533_29110 [Acidobacteriota bacterium]